MKDMMLACGEQPLTLSGRKCSPFPKVDCSTERKALNTCKRVDQWLWENVVAEAESRNDQWNLTQFRAANPKNLTTAEKDSMNMYLFEYQAAVVGLLPQDWLGDDR